MEIRVFKVIFPDATPAFEYRDGSKRDLMTYRISGDPATLAATLWEEVSRCWKTEACVVTIKFCPFDDMEHNPGGSLPNLFLPLSEEEKMEFWKAYSDLSYG